MKSICVKTLYKREKHYEVKFGNGSLYKFSSKRTAKRFLAETNRFLTSVLFSLNEILPKLYKHTREVWIANGKHQLCRSLKSQIEIVEHVLDNSHKRSAHKDGNYFTFIDLKKACEFSKKIIKELESVKSIQNTDTIRKHKLESLYDAIQVQQFKLNNYGEAYKPEKINVRLIEDIYDKVNMYVA